MLQQTRVEAVIPYYRKFLNKFATVEILASSSIDEVLAMWSGLGYYRRARQLHAAAIQISSSGGQIPRASSEWLELPGIGPYTAAAVASIAFGEVIPVLDGNVERLLSRRLAWEGNPKKSAGKRVLSAAAARLLDQDRPGDSNQALMELGATICRPRSPRCEQCPLIEGCEGFSIGQPDRFPVPQKRRPSLKVELAVIVVKRDSRVLMFRRPKDSSVMADLWELPNVPLSGNSETMEKGLGSQYGGFWRLEPLGVQVRHQVTYRALNLHLFSAVVDDGGRVGEGPEAAWVDIYDSSNFAMSSMVGKILSRLSGKGRGSRGNGRDVKADVSREL